MAENLRDVIRQIKEATDIVEVVGRTVALKRAGASFKACCPFHQEKTPSFNVVPQKGIFHCFGCGAGGTVIDFVMKTERLEFMEAVEKLAKEAGIDIPRQRQRNPAELDAEKRLLNSVQKANETALQWFRRNLLEERNPLANKYLPERGLTPDIVERFQLGAAPDSWDSLKTFLVSMGYSEEMLVDAGLCVRSEKGRVYDRFRNRLIFPIWDQNGRVCGFGGRQLVKEEGSPKYLNSAETVLYKKGHILYGLNLAKDDIVNSGYAILCEGYMDVIMCHIHGHTQAVASLGTALTRDQARLLKRYAARTYFLYDGDSAGQRAMLKGGEPLLEADFDVRMITLPAEDDPDTFLQREGGDALRAKMTHAEEYFDFALRVHMGAVDAGTLAGQAELVERMVPTLNALKNEVMREGAMGRLLKRLGGLPRDAVEKIMQRKLKEATRGRDEHPPARPQEEREEERKSSNEVAAPSRDMLERSLLKMMIESNGALELIRTRLHHDWIAEDRLAPWIFFLNDHDGYAETLLDAVEASREFPGDRQVITDALAWSVPKPGCTPEMAEQLLIRLQERHQGELTRQLLAMIDRRELRPDDADKLLNAFHQEHRNRIQLTKGLRTGSSAERSMRRL